MPPDDFSESPLLSRKVAARRAGDDDDLVFDCLYKVCLNSFVSPILLLLSVAAIPSMSLIPLAPFYLLLSTLTFVQRSSVALIMVPGFFG